MKAGPPKGFPVPHRGEKTKIPKFASREVREQYGLAHEGTIVEVTTDEGVREAADWCREQGAIAWDTETTGLQYHLDDVVLCQVGTEEKQFLIWVDGLDLSPIHALLADDSIPVFGVNLGYDAAMWLADFGLDKVLRKAVDVQINDQIIGCGILGDTGTTLARTSMESMVSRWEGFNIPKDEDLRIGWGRFHPDRFPETLASAEDEEERQYLQRLRKAKMCYAADDCIWPMRIAPKQRPWIIHLDLVETINLESRYLPVLAESLVRGIKIDKEKWAALADESIANFKEALRELDKQLGTEVEVRIDEQGHASYSRDIDYTSTYQLREALREWMWDQYGVDLICTNGHFRESLERWGMVNERRLDRIFEKKLVPDPKKEGKNMQVGYPKNSDLVEDDDIWDMLKRYLPSESFRMTSTDADTLSLMKVIFQTPEDVVDDKLPTTIGLPPAIVDPILEFRGQGKIISTYGYNWFAKLHPETDRIHVQGVQGALSTGRLSTRPNIQNPPGDQERRACFIAEDGYVYVGRDWSQIEPRIQAELSRDPVLMRVFWSGHPDSAGFARWCGDDVTEELDLYTEVGKPLGIIPNHYGKLDTKGDPDQGIEPKPDGAKGRKQMKIVVLGLSYGTGVWKFFLTFIRDTGEHQTWQFAKKLYYGYFDSVPRLKETLDELSDLADPRNSPRKIWHPFAWEEVSWAESLGGRKRFFDSRSPTWWTQGRNQPIQGTGADILKRAAVELWDWLQEQDFDAGIVNQLHDEFLIETEEGYAEVVSKKTDAIMTSVGERYCPHVPITSDGYIAEHWIKD